MTTNFDYWNGTAAETVTRKVEPNGNIVWRSDSEAGYRVKTIIVRDGEQVGVFETGGAVNR